MYCKARFATLNVQTRNRAGHKQKLQIKTPATKSTVTWSREVYEVFGLQMKNIYSRNTSSFSKRSGLFWSKKEKTSSSNEIHTRTWALSVVASWFRLVCLGWEKPV